MLRHVDLCSGIGGFSLAFEEVGLSKTIMFCDTEKWCRDILAKHWPNVPITEDVKELANDPERLVPDCDILTAGYPCQPFSVAGKQRGTEDDRHIWPYIFRIVASKRPAWLCFENVYGHVGMGLDEVLHDLEGEGYATRTFIVPASGVGAPHKRDRLWIIARTMDDTESNRDCGDIRKLPKAYESTPQPQKQHKEKSLKPLDASANTAPLAHTTDNGCTQWEATGRKGSENQQVQQPSFWSEPVGPSKDVAHTEGKGGERWKPGESRVDTQRQSGLSGRSSAGILADTSRNKLQGCSEEQIYGESNIQSQLGRSGEDQREQWSAQPELGGMADGLPSRLDGFDGWEVEPEDIPRVVTGMTGRANRLKGLGNAIVPRIAMNIGLAIKEMVDA